MGFSTYFFFDWSSVTSILVGVGLIFLVVCETERFGENHPKMVYFGIPSSGWTFLTLDGFHPFTSIGRGCWELEEPMLSTFFCLNHDINCIPSGLEYIWIPKRIPKHKLILILVYTTPPCSCCFAFFWTTFLLTCDTSWRYRRMLWETSGIRSRAIQLRCLSFPVCDRCKRQRLRCQVLKLSRRSWRNWTTSALDWRLGE